MNEAVLITVPEAGRILCIGRTKAYELATNGELPGVIRIGKSLRVNRRRLLEWIEQQTAAVAS